MLDMLAKALSAFSPGRVLSNRSGCRPWLAKNGVVPVDSDNLLLYAICAIGNSDTQLSCR